MALSPAPAQQLKKNLLAQPNWQEKYRTLLQAAKQAPTLAPDKRIDLRKVSGCEAQVWLDVGGDSGSLNWLFYSDARLVHALIHATLLPLQGQSADTVQSFDAEKWLSECGLADQLSPSRSNGLQQVVEAAKALASAQAAND